MQRIELALAQLFRRHRIVFWYDVKKQMRDVYEALGLPEIAKIELANNAFGVKYRILRQEPDRRFLLYHEGPAPADLDNWLLDVQLAQGEFHADQVGLWLAELELGSEFADLVAAHDEFFKEDKRRQDLKRLLAAGDHPAAIERKMAAICTAAEARIEDILESLLAELAEGREDKIGLLTACNLEAFFWTQVNRHYGYDSAQPGIRDFAIELFKSCYAMETAAAEDKKRLNQEALVFLKRWKDSIRHHQAFETLSATCAEDLGIEADLNGKDLRCLTQADLFELIDRKIIRDLAQAVANQTISAEACLDLVRQRRDSHWYPNYHHLYEAIAQGACFVHALESAKLEMETPVEGFQRYTGTWHAIDGHYRRFIFHMRKSGQPTLLEKLTELVEGRYDNLFLRRLNDVWQQAMDTAKRPLAINSQGRFFETWVRPFLAKDNKVFVIVSDGLRYEIGAELLGRIRGEDRYEAEIEAAMTLLPSFTQLGMAALLPHRALALTDDQSATVLADGHSTRGLDNRVEVLQQTLGNRATAVKADSLLAMNKDACRGLVRDHDVVYVFHNRIDAVGDKRETEERVFEAVEEALDELVRIVKKLTAANANNLLLTADHGFIYQNRALQESDFSSAEPAGKEIFYRDRRFVIGKGLVNHDGLTTCTAADLGLEGDVEIQMPKSINRFRLRGSGSRYVHGGAALQEVVIPVLKIRKKRQSDISQVEVDILKGAASVITSGQLAVAFYQREAVGEKVKPRTLRVGIYDQAGALISDRHDLTFDAQTDDARKRETKVRFILTRKADQANNQEVILRMDEPITGTTQYREYKREKFMLRRSFTSDFDF